MGLDVRVPLSDSAITLTRLWLAAHRIIYVADPCHRRPSCHPPLERIECFCGRILQTQCECGHRKCLWSFCSSCAQTMFAREYKQIEFNRYTAQSPNRFYIDAIELCLRQLWTLLADNVAVVDCIVVMRTVFYTKETHLKDGVFALRLHCLSPSRSRRSTLDKLKMSWMQCKYH